ncbi:MAG: hypothetical protein RLZ98_3289 [Pseudomonadota bacterium]|jgi:hypothetical protein
MNPAIAGMLGGAILGLVNFGFLRWTAARMEQEARKDQSAVVHKEQAPRPANLIRALALIEIPLFAGIGYFVGPFILGQS